MQTKKELTSRGRTEYPEDFKVFWKTYPGNPNQSKNAALIAWNKAIETGYMAEEIIAGAKCHRLVRMGEPPEFTQHASTWLSLTYEKGRGWETYDPDHWAWDLDELTYAIMGDIKIALDNPNNNRSINLILKEVFQKYAKSSWTDGASIPEEAKSFILAAKTRLEDTQAPTKIIRLPENLKPNWDWQYEETETLVTDWLKRRLQIGGDKTNPITNGEEYV